MSVVIFSPCALYVLWWWFLPQQSALSIQYIEYFNIHSQEKWLRSHARTHNFSYLLACSFNEPLLGSYRMICDVFFFVYDDVICFHFCNAKYSYECDQWNSVRFFLNRWIFWMFACVLMNVCMHVGTCCISKSMSFCISSLISSPPPVLSAIVSLLFWVGPPISFTLVHSQFMFFAIGVCGLNWYDRAKHIHLRAAAVAAAAANIWNTRPKICIAENLFLAYGWQ